jgi:galactitol PTS system EIIB component
MVNITVATGTSQHKLEFAVQTIQSYFESRNLPVKVNAVNVYTWNIQNDNPDLIVLIGPQTFKTSVPVVSGVAFVTKIGMEKVLQEIESKLHVAGKL